MDKQELKNKLAANLPETKFVLSVLEKLMEDYEITDCPINFVDTLGCGYKYNADNTVFPARITKHQFRFGFDSVKYHLEDKWYEYKSLYYLYENFDTPTGYMSVLSLCLHEFAHLLHHKQHGVIQGDAHGRLYQRTYRELIEKYYNNEFMWTCSGIPLPSEVKITIVELI